MSLLDARLLDDCARNLRIAYRLPIPVDEGFLEAAGVEAIVRNRFSAFVAGARDHLAGTFPLEVPVRVEAVDGLDRLTATFGSLHARARPEAAAEVERRLEAALSAI